MRMKVPNIIWGESVKLFSMTTTMIAMDKSSNHCTSIRHHHTINHWKRAGLSSSPSTKCSSATISWTCTITGNRPQDNTWCRDEPPFPRRSLVKKLKNNQNGLESKHDKSREIMDMVVSGLPPNLVQKGMMRANPNKKDPSYTIDQPKAISIMHSLPGLLLYQKR